MIRFLCLSISFLVLGCASSLPTLKSAQADVACIKKFKPVFNADLYNASIDVVGKHLSGLVLFKSMPDSSLRVVFTNEAGIKFFDFGFEPDGSFKAHQVIKQLNKKAVVKTLRQDFELLLMRRAEREMPKAYASGSELKFGFAGKKDTDFVVTNETCTSLLRMEKSTSKEIKTTAHLFGAGIQAPDSIRIKHFNFNMNIRLKRLER
jgi:hypothetical protein